MATNQLHGKRYEQHITQAFPKSLLSPMPPTATWDILAEHDEKLNIPTSVKTTKNNSIGMSDARKFVSTNCTFRLIVAQYRQESGYKVFSSMMEFIITPEIMKKIRNELTLEFVKEYHDSISAFGPGKENQRLARAVAKQYKEKLNQINTLITLNPKIDSKDQRRLQCSIKLDQLMNLVQPNIYTTDYRGVDLRLKITSPSRSFNKKAA